MTSRVVVFIDYENMHRCASNEFAVGNGHFWPWDLGNELVARRNADPTVPASERTQVRVYRGVPDTRLQPRANAANQAQGAAWRAAVPHVDALHLVNRPLRYPPRWPNGKEIRKRKASTSRSQSISYTSPTKEPSTWRSSAHTTRTCHQRSTSRPRSRRSQSTSRLRPGVVDAVSHSRTAPTSPGATTSIETHLIELAIRVRTHEAPDQNRNVREDLRSPV